MQAPARERPGASRIGTPVLKARRCTPESYPDGMASTRDKTFLLAGLTVAIACLASVAALAAMRSERLPGGICETVGGARIVELPNFPGERIDRRLLSDVRYLERKYKIFVTDGYSNDPIHSYNGEHPLGLALDIVPNTAAGGTWRDVSALARWAEPRQDQPTAPFRWVGYDGDAGHGRGNHLHLSWNHSETKPGVSPATVYTRKCPTRRVPSSGGGGRPKGEGKTSSGTGGIETGSGGPTGGIEPARALRSGGSVVAETGGADFGDR